MAHLSQCFRKRTGLVLPGGEKGETRIRKLQFSYFPYLIECRLNALCICVFWLVFGSVYGVPSMPAMHV